MKFLKQNKLVGLLLAALVFLVPIVAHALVEPKEVDAQIRTYRYVIPEIVVADATEVVVDVDGVIAAPTIWSGSAAQDVSNAESAAQDVGTLPYPAKLNVILIDGGAASGALTCTSIVIRGFDQFGRRISDTVSTITESATKGTKVFGQVTSYASTGCAIASGGDTSDILRISGSLDIGLPQKVGTYSDIISLCIRDDSDTPDETQCFRGAGTVTGSRESLQEQGSVDLTYHAVNLADSDFDVAAANADQVSIVMRTTDVIGLR